MGLTLIAEIIVVKMIAIGRSTCQSDEVQFLRVNTRRSVPQLNTICKESGQVREGARLSIIHNAFRGGSHTTNMRVNWTIPLPTPIRSRYPRSAVCQIACITYKHRPINYLGMGRRVDPQGIRGSGRYGVLNSRLVGFFSGQIMPHAADSFESEHVIEFSPPA